jgi:hypothetical protein
MDCSVRQHVAAFAVLALALVLPAMVDARSFRTDQVPRNKWGCALCHTSSVGGGPLNAFGRQVESRLDPPKAQADVPWRQIYDLDADGDGYTNGEELNDPNGSWRVGDPEVSAPVTHPGRSSKTPCGNGTLEGPEVCDGSNLDDQTCQSLGEPMGRLACRANCTFDRSGCTGGAGGMDAGPTRDVGPSTDVMPRDDAGGDRRDTAIGTLDTGHASDVRRPNDTALEPEDGGGQSRDDAGASGGLDANDDASQRAPSTSEDERMSEGGCSTSGDGSPLEHGLVVILTLIGAGLTLLYRSVTGTENREEEANR